MNDRAMKTLFASTRIQAAATAYGDAIDVSMYKEATFFQNVSAQGSYTDETLDGSIQTKDYVSGNWVELIAFTQVTDVTGTVPNTEKKVMVANLGSHIRFKRITAGTSVDYTFSCSVMLKG